MWQMTRLYGLVKSARTPHPSKADFFHQGKYEVVRLRDEASCGDGVPSHSLDATL